MGEKVMISQVGTRPHAGLDRGEQFLRDDRPHVEGKRAADRAVHSLWKKVQNTADRAGGGRGVNRAENKVARLGRLYGRLERLRGRAFLPPE